MEKPRYHCPNCGEDFDEPHERRTTYESEYGVAHLFGGNNTPCIVYACPYCHNEDIEENETIEEDEENGKIYY